MDIYGHLQIAEEILNSGDLNPELNNLLLKYKNYFNIGNFVPDLQYLVMRLILVTLIKNIFLGVRDYRRITKETHLEHIRCHDVMLNAFKTIDDNLRYSDRKTIIDNNRQIRKQIALLCGIIGHFFADRYIHYYIEKIQSEQKYNNNGYSKVSSHQQIEISFSYYLLKNKDMDWYDFTEDVRIPMSKKWWRKIFLVRDEAIHPMLQQMDLLTYGDSLTDTQINVSLNNLVLFGKYIKHFSIYKKIKNGKYIFDFDEMKLPELTKDELINGVYDKLLPKLASALNLTFDLLKNDSLDYFDKQKTFSNFIGPIDASKPEEFYFNGDINETKKDTSIL